MGNTGYWTRQLLIFVGSVTPFSPFFPVQVSFKLRQSNSPATLKSVVHPLRRNVGLGNRRIGEQNVILGNHWDRAQPIHAEM